MSTDVTIGGRKIGPSEPPFVIAEMSGNHNQSLDRALEIVEAAAAAGADALKLQTYTADTMTIDVDRPEFRIEDAGSLWAGETLYSLYEKAHTPWEWHAPIFQRARELGLIVFSTPFDDTAVEFLETLDVPCYKIASFENTDLPLIRRVAATGKPLIMSTGMATAEELHESVSAAREAGCTQLVLLKCTSTYPAAIAESNLLTIPGLRATFECEAGVSDHTMGAAVSVAAVALGATVVEKHFTISRADGGVDAAFSMEPGELAKLVVQVEQAHEALGSVSYGPTEGECASLRLRRSLYIVRDMRAGEAITPDALRAIRPGLGLAPKFYDDLVGRRLAVDVQRGTPASWDLMA